MDNDQLDAAAAGAEELLDELDELEESDEPDFDVDELVLDEDESDDELEGSVLPELPVLVFFPDSRLSVR